jgi:glycerophosphoryl diester phosphodiesterase
VTADRLRLAQRAPAIVAHRGSWSHHRENTLAAFSAALDEGADMVELDVWLSADGVPIVHHDEGIGDLGNIPIASLTQAQLASEAAYIPCLDEVFAWAKDRMGVYVELKGPDTPQPVAALVREHGIASQVVIGSFLPDLVAGVRKVDSELRTSILFHTTVIGEALELGHGLSTDFLHPCWKRASDCPSDLLDDAAVERIQTAGFGIVTWDEDRPEVLEALLRRTGIEALSTNLPSRLAALRAGAWEAQG